MRINRLTYAVFIASLIPIVGILEKLPPIIIIK